MDARVRASCTALGFTAFWSAAKFALFALTGSLAILAEAWHSFSDVGTTLIVLLALARGAASAGGGRAGAGRFGRAGRFLRETSAEQYSAFGIGILLAGVSAGLMARALGGERVPIERPLEAGLCFLFFSLGSYFVYRYEVGVGRATGSVGLVSDGLHSKADMAASLAAGVSLIAYSRGIDVDRPTAFAISLLVMGFAAETLAGAVALRLGGGGGFPEWLGKSSPMMVLLDAGRRKAVAGMIGRRLGEKRLRYVRGAIRAAGRCGAAALAMAYAGTAVFVVGATEEAVVLRWGRPAGLGATAGPGLHFKLPWPIDRAAIVDVKRVRRSAVGNAAAASSPALLWTKPHGTEEAFATGDKHLVYPFLSVHWRICRLSDYMFRHADAERLMGEVAAGVATRAIAGAAFDRIAGEGRGGLEDQMAADIRSEMEVLRTGIEVLGVHLRDLHPPMAVAETFERVVAARQEKAQAVNRALGYRNQRLAESRGLAARLAAEAEAYERDRTEKAKGDAARFGARIPEKGPAQEITRTRMRLDAAGAALGAARLVLVDPAAGTPTVLADDADWPEIGEEKGGQMQ